jgi:hypothetical protein
MIERYLSYATLVGIFVLLFLITKKAKYQPGIADNHTTPPKMALEIAVAEAKGRPAIFHGGCVRCLWRHQNTTHAGIAFCRGCMYSCWDQKLPDKSICEYDLEKF